MDLDANKFTRGVKWDDSNAVADANEPCTNNATFDGDIHNDDNDASIFDGDDAPFSEFDSIFLAKRSCSKSPLIGMKTSNAPIPLRHSIFGDVTNHFRSVSVSPAIVMPHTCSPRHEIINVMKANDELKSNTPDYESDAPAAPFLGEDKSVFEYDAGWALPQSYQRATSLGSMNALRNAEAVGPCLFAMPSHMPSRDKTSRNQQCAQQQRLHIVDILESVPLYSWILPYIVDHADLSFMSSLKPKLSKSSESIDNPYRVYCTDESESATRKLPTSTLNRSKSSLLMAQYAAGYIGYSSSTSPDVGQAEARTHFMRDAWTFLGPVLVSSDPSWRPWVCRLLFLCDNFLFECLPPVTAVPIGYDKKDDEGDTSPGGRTRAFTGGTKVRNSASILPLKTSAPVIIGYAPLNMAVFSFTNYSLDHINAEVTSEVSPQEMFTEADPGSLFEKGVERTRIIQTDPVSHSHVFIPRHHDDDDEGREVTANEIERGFILTPPSMAHSGIDSDIGDSSSGLYNPGSSHDSAVGLQLSPKAERKTDKRIASPAVAKVAGSALCISCLSTSREAGPRKKFYLRPVDSDDFTPLEETLCRAAAFDVQDRYDLRCGEDSDPKGGRELGDHTEGSLLLGKGRFSEVRMASRRASGSLLNSVAQLRALKLISKEVFWSCVQLGKERPDALVREVLAHVLVSQSGIEHHSRGRSSPEKPGGGVQYSISQAAHVPLVQLFSILETVDGLALELELMQPVDLYDFVTTRCGRFSELQTKQIILQLIDAVAACLRAGVVHRDVKLSNIIFPTSASTLLSQAARHPEASTLPVGDAQQPQWQQVEAAFVPVKLADFGLAGFVSSSGSLRGRCGTPGFVAPDILRVGLNEGYHYNVDMFSIGVVAYILLGGYEPFQGSDDQQLILANRSAQYEFHMPEWSHVSPEGKDFVSKLLVDKAEERLTPTSARQHPWLATLLGS